MGEMTEVGELALMGEILQMDGNSGVVHHMHRSLTMIACTATLMIPSRKIWRAS